MLKTDVRLTPIRIISVCSLGISNVMTKLVTFQDVGLGKYQTFIQDFKYLLNLVIRPLDVKNKLCVAIPFFMRKEVLYTLKFSWKTVVIVCEICLHIDDVFLRGLTLCYTNLDSKYRKIRTMTSILNRIMFWVSIEWIQNLNRGIWPPFKLTFYT